MKMIINTMIGGKSASAASVDGATAPTSRPSADDATEFNTVMPRKVRNASVDRLRRASG